METPGRQVWAIMETNEGCRTLEMNYWGHIFSTPPGHLFMMRFLCDAHVEVIIPEPLLLCINLNRFELGFVLDKMKVLVLSPASEFWFWVLLLSSGSGFICLIHSISDDCVLYIRCHVHIKHTTYIFMVMAVMGHFCPVKSEVFRFSFRSSLISVCVSKSVCVFVCVCWGGLVRIH